MNSNIECLIFHLCIYLWKCLINSFSQFLSDCLILTVELEYVFYLSEYEPFIRDVLKIISSNLCLVFSSLKSDFERAKIFSLINSNLSVFKMIYPFCHQKNLYLPLWRCLRVSSINFTGFTLRSRCIFHFELIFVDDMG